MSLLPPFTDDGVLPVGDHVLTLDQLLVSPLVLGWRDGSDWGAPWRQTLSRNLAVMVNQLQQVGIREVFVDGSFVEAKPHPNDIDELPMWHRYRVELYPHVGQFTGIVDAFGHELTFPSAFRQSRGFRPKGIVKIGGLS